MLYLHRPLMTSKQEAEALDDAWDRATVLLDQPTRRPDSFRFLLPVSLDGCAMPVPCVATIGIDRDGRPAVDGAWIFRPGLQAIWCRRGKDFSDISADAIGEHWNDLRARAAEQRAAHPLAA